MTQINSSEKIISLGHPSYVWRAGQERRLQMIHQRINLRGKRVLDVGCGLGLYLQRFLALGAKAHGIELDADRAEVAKRVTPNVRQGSAEALPYPEGMFDLIFSNEVLEHVNDDREAVRQAWRVLAPGGHLVIFVPNRLYPFETHGWYWRGTYRFGNIPLINYLPDSLRDRFCPHVRAYTRHQLRALFKDLPGEIVVHQGIFAGYDNIVSRWPILGRWLKRTSYALEKTPLQWLGLSHFLIFRKGLPDEDARRQTDSEE